MHHTPQLQQHADQVNQGARMPVDVVRRTIELYNPLINPRLGFPDPLAVEYKRRYLDFLDRYPDSCTNRYNYLIGVHGHLTSQAYVFNPDLRAIALAPHKIFGYLIAFGGHIDPDDTDLIATARREAAEEAGLVDLTLYSSAPIDIDIHGFPAKGDQPDHWHYDVRFAFTTRQVDFAPAPGESMPIWVRIDDLHNRMEKWTSNNRLVQALQETFGSPVP